MFVLSLSIGSRRGLLCHPGWERRLSEPRLFSGIRFGIQLGQLQPCLELLRATLSHLKHNLSLPAYKSDIWSNRR